MRKVLLTLAVVAAFAAALAGPAEQLVNPDAPISQHAEVIIDPPGYG